MSNTKTYVIRVELQTNLEIDAGLVRASMTEMILNHPKYNQEKSVDFIVSVSAEHILGS